MFRSRKWLNHQGTVPLNDVPLQKLGHAVGRLALCRTDPIPQVSSRVFVLCSARYSNNSGNRPWRSQKPIISLIVAAFVSILKAELSISRSKMAIWSSSGEKRLCIHFRRLGRCLACSRARADWTSGGNPLVVEDVFAVSTGLSTYSTRSVPSHGISNSTCGSSLRFILPSRARSDIATLQ